MKLKPSLKTQFSFFLSGHSYKSCYRGLVRGLISPLRRTLCLVIVSTNVRTTENMCALASSCFFRKELNLFICVFTFLLYVLLRVGEGGRGDTCGGRESRE